MLAESHEMFQDRVKSVKIFPFFYRFLPSILLVNDIYAAGTIYKSRRATNQFNTGEGFLSLSRLICVSQRDEGVSTTFEKSERRYNKGARCVLFVIFILLLERGDFFGVSVRFFIMILCVLYTFIYCVYNMRFHVFFFLLLPPSCRAIFLETMSVVYTYIHTHGLFAVDENHLLFCVCVWIWSVLPSPLSLSTIATQKTWGEWGWTHPNSVSLFFSVSFFTVIFWKFFFSWLIRLCYIVALKKWSVTDELSL